MAYSQYLVIDEESTLNCIFPIGSLYFSASSINPKEYLGGDWKPIGTNGSGGVYLYAVNNAGVTTEGTKAGYSWDKDEVSHSHGATSTTVLTESQLPIHYHVDIETPQYTSYSGDHNHTQQGYWTVSNWWSTGHMLSRTALSEDPVEDCGIQPAGEHTHDVTISYAGTTSPIGHNHLIYNNSDGPNDDPLFLKIYIWERIS